MQKILLLKMLADWLGNKKNHKTPKNFSLKKNQNNFENSSMCYFWLTIQQNCRYLRKKLAKFQQKKQNQITKNTVEIQTYFWRMEFEIS